MSYGLSLASWYLDFTAFKTQAGKAQFLAAAVVTYMMCQATGMAERR